MILRAAATWPQMPGGRDVSEVAGALVSGQGL